MSRKEFAARRRKQFSKLREQAASRKAEKERIETEKLVRLARGDKPLECGFCHDQNSFTFAELSDHVRNSCTKKPAYFTDGWRAEYAAKVWAANMLYPGQIHKLNEQGRKHAVTKAHRAEI